MKRIVIIVLALFFISPAILSFISNHYLESYLFEELDESIEIKKFNFNPGWFTSHAQIDFVLKKYNLQFNTRHDIANGLLIWRALLDNPSEFFGLYQINSQYNLVQSQQNQDGNIKTFVYYTSKVKQQYDQLGLNLLLSSVNLYSDIPKLTLLIEGDGEIQQNLNANEFEISFAKNNVYLKKLSVDLVNSDITNTIPKRSRLSADKVYATLSDTLVTANAIQLAHTLNSHQQSYDFDSTIEVDQLAINGQVMDKMTIVTQATQFDHQIIRYLSENMTQIKEAIDGKIWLALFDHGLKLFKLLNEGASELKFNIESTYQENPIHLRLASAVKANDRDELDPFSISENLSFQFSSKIPITLVEELANQQTENILTNLSEQGIIRQQAGYYHLNISYLDGKLKL